jgi:hypothetical protein
MSENPKLSGRIGVACADRSLWRIEQAALDLARLKRALDGGATHTCSIMRPAHSGDRQSVARANG